MAIKTNIVLLFCMLMFLGMCSFQATKCSQLFFLPMPQTIDCNISDSTPTAFENPCKTLFTVKSEQAIGNYSHFVELIEHQQYRAFGCRLAHVIIGDSEGYQLKGFDYRVNI